MLKLLSGIMIIMASSSVFSFEHLNLNGALRTQDVVKMKLWYEGIEVQKQEKQVVKAVELPEELLVPLISFRLAICSNIVLL